ncbi:hypothetical protein JHK85_028339 [Glycine max]|nr:hypothetical protein JHK85_028339 [Glycine max]
MKTEGGSENNVKNKDVEDSVCDKRVDTWQYVIECQHVFNGRQVRSLDVRKPDSFTKMMQILSWDLFFWDLLLHKFPRCFMVETMDKWSAMRTMDDIHDLFIVGRGQGVISPLTTGLTDWSECLEIGAIRDMLATEGDGEVLEWSTRVSIVKGIAKDPLEDEGSNYPQDLVLVPRGTEDDSVVVGSHIRGSRLRASAAGDEEKNGGSCGDGNSSSV